MASENRLSIKILIFLVSFASVSAVLIAPALPAIAEFFKVTPNQSQLIITFFLIGYALGQLPYGPLANRFGRKKALYIGIIIALLGSILCIIASKQHMFWLLVWSRFIMALGSSVGLKITFTMIGDRLSQTQAAHAMSYMVLAFAIGPPLGISIGGMLTQRFGWQSCFYFLAFYSLALLLLGAFLPETSKEMDKEALQIPKIIQGFAAKLRQPKLIISAFIMGGIASILYVFSAQAPFIAKNVIGLNPEQYGFYNLVPPLGLIAGSFASRMLIAKQTLTRTIGTGAAIMLCGIALMTVAFLLSWVNIVTLFFLMIIILMGNSIIYANVTAVAMEGAKNKANAAAVLNFINISLCVLAVFALEIFNPSDPLVMPFIFLISGFIVVCLIGKLFKIIHRRM